MARQRILSIALVGLLICVVGCGSDGGTTSVLDATPTPPPTATPTLTPSPTPSPIPSPTPIPLPTPSGLPVNCPNQAQNPVGANALVVVNYAGVIRAIARSGGAPVWCHSALGPDLPALANGVVYAVTSAGLFGSDGHVYAWDASTGAQRWQFQDRDDNYGPTVVGNVLYVGANQDGVYALQDNGASAFALLWHARPGTRLDSKSIPGADGGLVYIGEGDNHVYALSATDGSIKWSFATQSFVDASPLVAGGVVYVGPVGCSAGACVYALDAATGAQIWARSVPGGHGSGGDHDLIVHNGVVYGRIIGNSVFALNAQDGSILWQSAVASGGYLLGDDSELYMEAPSSESRGMVALNRTDGSLRWQLNLANTQYSLLAVDQGIVYVGEYHTDSKASYIRALTASAASPIWSEVLALPQPTPTPGS